MENVGKGLGLTLCVAKIVYEVDTWETHENEKGNLQFCKTFCLKKMRRCWRWHGNTVEVLRDEVETVKGFCYLGDRLNASGGCETAVTSRVRIGWMNFRECGELLRGRRFFLRMKGKVYRSGVRSAMLYGSETWRLRESAMAILRRTERVMVRSMCGVKLVDRKNMEELMEMLGLKERWIEWQRRMK